MKPITHPLAIAHLEARAKFLSAYTKEADESEAVTRAAWEDAGYPLYANPPPNTVKVRVAVSVDENGVGCADCLGPNEEVSTAPPGERMTVLVAHVPLPEPAAEIVADVESD